MDLERFARRRVLPYAAAFLAAMVAALAFQAILSSRVSVDMVPLPMRLRNAGAKWPGSDYAAFYEPVAREILAGHGVQMPGGRPALRVPPGYPVLIAALYGIAHALGLDEWQVVSASVFVWLGLAATLVLWIARRTFGTRQGLLAAALFVSCPLNLWTTWRAFTEPVFIVLFLAAVGVLLRELEQDARAPGGLLARAGCSAPGCSSGRSRC